ncbi:efflux RND transporter permease subunit [Thioalkalivibrio sp. XN279]|uniref:efflux RND transporter permease subunit n=1 Tax=Thioalkalivibrio sp. XN279 TaxID=2714953 RepID=UPI0014097702|nr:efflux RND transporter permease subunit [Thioalkalivibrio sp. XN279]NHA13584.1 efflux RND transporter permease subunit [Thioalkalivibrio sp. XN279]
MRLVDIATQRRVTIAMFTLAVVLFGFVSLSRLKVNLLPDLSYPTLTVRTELDGSAPLEVESLLTRPIEEAVGTIKNIRQVRSVSRPGQSDVVLEFLWGTDMDIAGVEVREKLDVLQLPLEASRPLLLRFDPSNEPIQRLAFIYEAPATGIDETARLQALRRFAEDRLKNDIEAVEGVAAVKVSGGLEDEIQVLVDQEKLAQLGLSIQGVAGRLRAENINLSGGRLEQGEQRFLVRTLNEFASVEEIADAVIATPEGRPLYLRDVATVTRGHKEREAITRVDGSESVELAVYKEGDANTVQVAQRVNQRVEAMGKRLPDGTRLRMVYDQSRFISNAISEVRNAALAGGLLAVLVLYAFLRDARATFIIGAAIPVSVIGTFLLMYSADVSLNIMSLGGIALAIGMLVDNSIVVLENIVRKREEGASILVAAQEGAGEVAGAVTAATLTTVAVFFPMVFVTGIAGQLFRDQALTVTFALLFSLLVALTLIPMLAARGGPARYAADEDAEKAAAQPGRVTRGLALVLRLFIRLGRGIAWAARWAMWPLTYTFQGFYKLAARAYAPLLAGSLRHRWLVLAAATVAFGSTLAIVPRLGYELLPQLAQGEFYVDVRLPAGSPIQATDAAIARLQERAAELPDLELSYSVAGTGNRLDASPVDAGEHTGRINFKLDPAGGREAEARAVAALRSSLESTPGIAYEFARPALFTLSTPLEIELAGYDLDQLADYARQIRRALEDSPRFADVRSTVEQGNPEIQIVFDQERAARLGLVVRDVADIVVAKVRGEVATRYTWRDKKIDVLVRSVDTRDASVAEVRNLIINPGSERPVPLEAVADIRLAVGPAEIRRADQSRVAIISANLAYGDLAVATQELEQILAGIPFSPGIAAVIAGQSAEMQASFNSMLFTLAMAVFLVYLVMASQFESLVHPFVILFTIPLALVGAAWALWLTGTTVSVVAFIGVIMLAGIVVNNAIVLVDLINQLRRAGLEVTAAILEAGRARLRPILMTTSTTVLGLLPMALGFGEGAEVRAPMAVAVIGGLVVSTLLTLVVIPVVYSLLDRGIRVVAAAPAEARG